MATSTPWGKADYTKRYQRGVTFYGTPSHGGFKVCRTLNERLPDYMRRADGWYEEDCDWAIVTTCFPELFTLAEREHAKDTLKNWHPDAYEKFYNVTIQPGESYKRREAYWRSIFNIEKHNMVLGGAYPRAIREMGVY